MIRLKNCILISAIFIVYFFTLPQNVFGADSTVYVVITDRFEELHIPVSSLKVIEDTSGTLDFTAALSYEHQNKFILLTKSHYKEGIYYWVKFTLLNKANKDKNWVLQLPLHTDHISLYVGNSFAGFKKYKTGQMLGFATRVIDVRTFAFELPSETNIPVDVYIHLYSKKHTDFSFILSNEKRYLEVHTKGYLFLGFIYGILFLMAIYNFILFLSIRDNIYIFYVIYTLSAIFFISWKDGLGFQFLWPAMPELNSIHYNLGLFLLLVTFLLYANDFLELKRRHRKLYLATFCIIGINFIYLVLNVFSRSYFEPLPFPYILSYLYFLGLAVYYLKNGYKPARYLIVSLLCITGALTVIKLRYMGLLGWNWFIEYVLNYAVAVEVITMSLATRDRITYMRRQKEEAKEAKLMEEKLRAENELITLQNKNLEREITSSNNELAFLATHLNEKKEFLNRLRAELDFVLKETPNNKQLIKLIKSLDNESEQNQDYEKFQLNFDKFHNNFLFNIRKNFPALKPSDLLLCAYIKLNKSNKEIASLLNISVSGVEKKRTRLKEKMDLKSEDNLLEFLINL